MSKEFSSICTHGDILYLGTPQTKDSVYNTLPGRGFELRIWPGRFPSDDQAVKYGTKLAPSIVQRALANPALRTGFGIDGSRGAPTDPERYDDRALVEKELDQGPEGFALQYMLDTSLSDEARQQLKLSNLIVANFSWESVPEVIPYRADPMNLVQLPATFPVPMTKMYYPGSSQCLYRPLKDMMMFIDPAGGGSDEMGWAVSGSLGPYIHLLRMGGFRGGFNDDNIQKLLKVLKTYGVKLVRCESNMGHGLFEKNLLGELVKAKEKDKFFGEVAVEGEYSTGQKERRIIDSMVSASQRHRIIIHPEVFEDDMQCGLQHSAEKRNSYSLWTQFSNITTDRGSLPHDDRIEAVAGAIRYHGARLVEDEEDSARRRAQQDAVEYMKNPMGYDDRKQRSTRSGGARAIVSRRRARH